MSITHRAALRAGLSLLACLAAFRGANAQGPFVNFELPSVEPIAVAKVGSAWYVLVCNGPDNAVEIYRASNNTFVTRVPVGQHPITVRWSSTLQAFFTCNYLGDSITRVDVQTSGGALPIAATVVATRHIGDEPADLLLLEGDTEALVTLNSSSALERIGTANLETVLATPIRLGDKLVPATHTKALKEPRRMSLLANGSVAVLGTRGGVDGPTSVYDFDLATLTFGPVGSLPNIVPQGLLGTSTFGMERSSDGRLWVTGNVAMIHVEGEPNLSIEQTGFVQSQLAVLDQPGTLGALPRLRNLNLTANQAKAVPGDAISMPTDVAVFEENGVVLRLFVTSFHSDRIAVLDVVGGPQTHPKTWPLSTIDLRPFLTGQYRNVGPRAFVLKPADASIPGDTARLYVANTLMPSFTVIDPAQPTAVPFTVALQSDPTPDFIRLGRKGLYDSRIAASGFVACASCHFDGGTDGLAWQLEKTMPNPVPIPAGLLGDGIDPTVTDYPDDKGPMVTQNLHGLVNHHVPGLAQELYSNKPYHWRGDRAQFTDFNAAFVNLMGAPNVGSPTDKKGLSDSEMQAYRAFIDSCVYPPNPEQKLDRKLSGDLGTPTLETDGAGALLGLKLFHIKELGGGRFKTRSCVHCHMGAAGSNNRLTEIDDPAGNDTPPQPIESAAIRSLRSREARIETGFGVTTQEIRTGQFGLTHAGPDPRRSINTFHATAFASQFTAGSPELAAVIEFVRQFDAGMAPIVGRTFTVDAGNVSAQSTTDAFRLAESQVLDASAGLAVHVRGAAGITGYWFDATVSPAVYREEGGATVHSRPSLRALVNATTILLVQSTPVGSERRIANPGGVATLLSGNPPSSVVLQPLHAPRHWRSVPGLTGNVLVPNWPTGQVPLARSLQTLNVYQNALIPTYVPQTRHEAVRRLCVSGNDLRAGAVLELGVPADASNQPAELFVIKLPIFPTNRLDSQDRLIWETTAELDPMFAYQLLLGGPAAPSVLDVFNAASPATLPTSFSPGLWNRYRVVVRNEDGSVNAMPTWQQLTID